jgi:hypothetical protein
MSMIVSSVLTSKNTCSTAQRKFPVSFTNVLKVLMVAGAYLQTGITAAMPNYCKENINEIRYGDPFLGDDANRLCVIGCAALYRQRVVDANNEEQLLAAQYKLGKCLACPWLYPPVMDNEIPPEQIKKEKEEHMEGLALILRSNCLNVLYPKTGETLQMCSDRFLATTPDISPWNYDLLGCRYFVSGTLICPDERTFNRLKDKIINRVYS